MAFQGRNRKTQHINRRVTQSAFKAFDFAYSRGRPFNIYAVVNLRESVQAASTTIFEAIRNKFRRWYKRKIQARGGFYKDPFYLYTLENPNGMPHVNWLLNLPDDMVAEFEKKLPVWVKKAQGACGIFDVHVQPISQKRREYKHLAKYVLKGTDALFIEHFFLDGVHAPQGIIYGKRAGVSLSLGNSTMKAANFNKAARKALYQQWDGAA